MEKLTHPLNDVRVANLRALVQKAGSQAKLARQHPGLDPTYVSQLLNGHRNFGEKSARKIETLLKLPYLYLDKDSSAENTIEINESNLLFYYRNLSDNQKAIIKTLMQEFQRNADR